MNKNKFFHNKITVCAIATLCCALWGSAFPCVKLGYSLMNIQTISSKILFAGLRFTLAGILTVLIGSVINRRLLVPKKESFGYIINLAFFQTVVQYIFFYIGLTFTTGVKASIIEGTCAFFSLLIACLIFRQEKLTVAKITACVIGFGGVLVSNLNGIAQTGGILGDVMIFISTVSYAFSSVLIKIYSKRENPVTLSGYQFTAGGLVLTATGLAMGGEIYIADTKSLLLLLYLGVLSAIAYSLWGILLKHNTVSDVTVYSFMIPVFGVILSALIIDSERTAAFGINNIIALLLVCVGIVIVNKFADKQNL